MTTLRHYYNRELQNRGLSFRDEFHTLPNNYQTTVDRATPGQLFRFTRINENTQKHVVTLLIGNWPPDNDSNIQFWNAVADYNVCGVISVDEVGGENVIARQHKISFNVSQSDHRAFQHFEWDRVNIRNLQTAIWSFTAWPAPGSKRLVPIVPHQFLDFLRAVLQDSYEQYADDQRPLLIIGRSLDIPALVAAIILLIHQACQEGRADVFTCVSQLREICGCDVISYFGMYEFIYECLLQIMTSTPTVMTSSPTDFAHMFRHLTSRPRGNFFGPDKTFFDMGANRSVQPIRLQFAMIKKLSKMYHKRLFPKLTSAELSRQERLVKPTKKHQFAPRLFNNAIWYSVLPSFKHRDHFLAIRGPVLMENLFGLMQSHHSRVLLWISETGNPNDILTAGGNASQSGVTIGRSKNHGNFCSFEMALKSSKEQRWAVTVFMFTGWPLSSGTKPVISNRNLLTVINSVLSYSELVVRYQSGSHCITLLEAGSAVVDITPPPLLENNGGCCGSGPPKKYARVEGCTWRGVMMGLLAYLHQRMLLLGEVDVYRTVQMFKMYDPFRTVINIHQYVWCYKMAWESCLLAEQLNNRPLQQQQPQQDDLSLTTVAPISARSYVSTASKSPRSHRQKVYSKKQHHHRPHRRGRQSAATSGLIASKNKRQCNAGCCCPCCILKPKSSHAERDRRSTSEATYNSSGNNTARSTPLATPRSHYSKASTSK